MLQDTILKVRDESGTGEIYNELNLHFDKLEVTVRDIITARVLAEVARYNKKAEEYKHALVTPKQDEITLNKYRGKTKPRVNAEKQIDVAEKAFNSNGFFILVDDKQVEGLEQVITIKPDTVIGFVKLTPLVGG